MNVKDTLLCVWVLRRHVYRDTGVKLLTAQRVTLGITICHSAMARAHHTTTTTYTHSCDSTARYRTRYRSRSRTRYRIRKMPV